MSSPYGYAGVFGLPGVGVWPVLGGFGVVFLWVFVGAGRASASAGAILTSTFFHGSMS